MPSEVSTGVPGSARNMKGLTFSHGSFGEVGRNKRPNVHRLDCPVGQSARGVSNV